ncbi:MAG: DUF3179 domain-containing protein [Bacteroidetes bacterium]|nr:MAG: DUF3179 domain-containing protein [Bacteroidota bacterium]
MNTIYSQVLLVLLCSLGLTASVSAQRAIFVEEDYADEAFDLSNSEFPTWELIPGGPGKDGIPALKDPAFVQAKQDNWLTDEDRVVGVSYRGITKAYPIRILNYHEVINDDFDGRSVAITYSPLCGSVVVYVTETGDEEWELGVSGLLYNNNALYFDRQTESLWSQVLGRAIAGKAAGAELQMLPATYTSWADWKARHPETLLLSQDTGHDRNYDLDAYAYYGETDRLMFPVNHTDERLDLKARVLGLKVGGVYKAYPYAVLATVKDGVTEDYVNGQRIRISFDAEAQAAYVTDQMGEPLPTASMYWFSWSAFHPDTQLHGTPIQDFPTTLSMSLGML